MKKMRFALFVFLVCLTQNCFSQFISVEHAKEDLQEFKRLLETQSSYFQLSKSNWEPFFSQLSTKIESRDSIFIPFFAFALEKAIAKTLDRHANIRMKDFEEDDIELYNLYFPFSAAPLNGKAFALQYNFETKAFEYFNSKYPYLKGINGLELDDFLSKYAYRRANCPAEARLQNGLQDLRKMGELYYKQEEYQKKEIEVLLSNGKRDKKVTLPLIQKNYPWSDIGSYSSKHELLMQLWRGKPFDFQQLHRWLGDSIAYLGIPEMLSYDDYPKFEGFLEKTLQGCHNAKGLVIDIRGNGGGTREILNTISKYIVPKQSSPWVANVAYVRSDQFLDEDIASMEERFLYQQDSENLVEEAQSAIEKFTLSFESELEIDPAKFSSPYFMVLESGAQQLSCPIYILVNEECFSAASIFAAAFKGLPNVKLAGITTNGSSGRSRNFYLSNSQIRVKFSTMVSLQRDGKTLDGNGTLPDILIPRDELQVMGKKDTQLEKLIEMIQER